MRYLILLLAVVMAGSRFSKLFKKDNVPETTVEDVLAEAADKKVEAGAKKDSFQSITREIESSGGKNTNHKTMEAGMHEGQRAVGRYGLMPKSISEMTKRMKQDGDLVPGALNALQGSKIDEQEIADLVAADSDLEQAVADKMYSHVNKRMGGDEEKMNHAWMYGHNLKESDLTPSVLEISPRTQKFRELRKKLSK